MFRFLVCALALSMTGCGDDANTSGPVLKSGRWYGYFVDFNDQLRGNFHGDVDINGNIQLHIEGTLVDFATRFNIDTNAAVLYEGSNFSISGNEGNLPVSGYGRERVFDTMFVVAIPIDSLSQHALTVGLDRWQFNLQGGASLNSVSGAWSVRSMQTGEINTGMFIGAPGDLFPTDAMDDGALDAPVDAPVDAGTD